MVITYLSFVTAENGEVGPTYKITVTRNQPSTDNGQPNLLIGDPLNLGAYLLGTDSNNPDGLLTVVKRIQSY